MQEAMSIKEFMNRDFKSEKREKVLKVAKVASAAVVILIVPDMVFASDGIDDAARAIYAKLLSVGKWIIIIKGGIDTINHMAQGDLPSAKKGFFGHLIVYMILNGLPWAMDEVDNLFKTEIVNGR